MHLWPSIKIRNSFKHDYFHNIERVNSENKRSQSATEVHQNFWLLTFCQEFLMIFSCCFCFGNLCEDDIGFI
ncbi:hypothetical protein BVRB_2g038250 [Beta vulgaris subsp. vulgaris]|nr:hypothetical protein BVRB_2g038250 [Beta vulgaris subsp. vulgaris]